ncbi:MAG: triose-phosphate isomerase [Desulfurococcales archaeon]|nr:triose-phosphate isomerase [Desulfurococcales archaeon]
MKYILAVNMKVYESAFGQKARELARRASVISSRYNGVEVILVAPLVNASSIAEIHDNTYIQHADSIGYGAYTGYMPVEALSHEGIKGVMVNHSEHKVTYRHLHRVIEKARALELKTLACGDTPEEVAGIAHLNPDIIAVEPPELIGTGIPVSKAKPEVITRALDSLRKVNPNIPLLAGAGISTPQDAIRSLELGSKGILVASAIMKAKEPWSRLEEFAEAMNNYK